MRVLVFDTETTGLPKTKLLTPEVLHMWPHVVQLSFVMYDIDDDMLISVSDYIIHLPKDIVMSNEIMNLHGITNEMCYSSDEKMEEVLMKLMGHFRNADLIIGHNIDFDLNMLKVELMRIIQKNISESVTNEYYVDFLEYIKNSTHYYCTMQESVDICAIEVMNKKGEPFIKFPKLIELHEKLFEIQPKKLHNSLNDVLVCLRCFYKLKFDADILEKSEPIKNLFTKLKLL